MVDTDEVSDPHGKLEKAVKPSCFFARRMHMHCVLPMPLRVLTVAIPKAEEPNTAVAADPLDKLSFSPRNLGSLATRRGLRLSVPLTAPKPADKVGGRAGEAAAMEASEVRRHSTPGALEVQVPAKSSAHARTLPSLPGRFLPAACDGLREALEQRGYTQREIIARSVHADVVVRRVEGAGGALAGKCIHEGKGEGSVRGIVQHEYSILSRVRHPNVARAVDFVEVDCGCVLIMELCAGASLYRSLARPCFSRSVTDEALPPPGLADEPCAEMGSIAQRPSAAWSASEQHAIVDQILSAVAHLHGLGIAHRDLHAGNVIVERSATPVEDGPALQQAVRAKLVDFGSARDRATDGAQASNDAIFADDVNTSILPPEASDRCCDMFSCDVFAIGLLMLGLIKGRVIYTSGVCGEGSLHLGLRGEAGATMGAHLAALLSMQVAMSRTAQAARDSLPGVDQWSSADAPGARPDGARSR